MSTSKEVVEEKIPWLLVIVLTVLFGLIVQPWVQLLGPMQTFYNLGLIVCSLGIGSAPFIPLLILWGLMRLGVVKRKVSPIYLISLFTVGSCAGWYGVWWSCGQTFWDWPNTRYLFPDLYEKELPWFLSPSIEELKPVLTGGAPVPWDAWMPTIAFWWAWFFFNGFFFVTLATIMRRHWIDVERVPFSHAMVAYEVIKRVSEEKPTERIWRTPFGIGIILGIIFNLPILLTYLFPWFPDIYAWRTNTCGHGAIMSLAGTPFWEIVGISMVDKHPLAVALMYLAPLNVLFTYWFWYFIYLILMQVAYIMGYYTGLKDAPTGCCRAWGPVSVRFAEPYKWNAFSRGAQIGLTIFYLIVSWRYFAETIKAALGRSEAYKDEPVPYRVSYGLFLLAFVLFTVLMLICGFSLLGAVLMPITAFLFWIANTRVWGTTGTYIQSAEGGVALYRLIMYPKAPEPPTGEFMMAGTWSGWHVNTPVEGNAGSFLSSFCAYRLASLTNVNAKSVFKILLVVQAILPIPFMISTLWLYYTIGGAKLVYHPLSYSAPVQRFAYPGNWNRIPGTEPWAHIFFAGMILTGVVAILHARFIWFPFEPIGFLMAFSDASLFFGMWLPALIAWILKTITLRVGGSKLYENYGIPVATGFAIGFISIAFIGGLIGIYRFFFPF
jgi:hypothetical protein